MRRKHGASLAPFGYAFDHPHQREPAELRELLGGKGAGLAEMTSALGLPVPSGVTITTETCRAYLAAGWPEGLSREVRAHIRRLESATGRGFGDADDPLLVSVRSGAAVSMPGMLDTLLNLGLNDDCAQGLADRTCDERFAQDAYRRLIATYGRIVLGVPGEKFETLLGQARTASGATRDAEIPASVIADVVRSYKELVEIETGRSFPEDPWTQLREAIEAVFASWNGPRAVAYRTQEDVPHDQGTAVNIQVMVFGNRDENSGTGVGFTRNPVTGVAEPYGDFLVNAQGEDIVAGSRATKSLSALSETWPSLHSELMDIFRRLEAHYRDMCEVEFTVEQGTLWMLQTRIGKRTGAAAVRMAVEMARQPGWRITKEEAVARVTAEHLAQLRRTRTAESDRDGVVAASGLPASPGLATGRAYFDPDDAEAAAEAGERVILIRVETSPEDVHGMVAAEGVLTTTGGLASHAAVVARGWGKPAVVGADAIEIHERSFHVGGLKVDEGDTITIDGSSGRVMLGEIAAAPKDVPDELLTLQEWARDTNEARSERA